MGDTVEIPLRTKDYYRAIFNKYDRNRDGFITVKELLEIVESREYDEDIPQSCVNKILKTHDRNLDKKLNFDEFYEMVTNPDLQHIFGHYMNRYIHLLVPKRHTPTTVTDGLYEEEYSCYPPAVGMIILSLVEVIFFCIDEATEHQSTNYATGPCAVTFIYEPTRRREAWRYLTYMFVHIGVFHLVLNLLVQILLGIPLEMVHKWWRVLVVYLAGVLAGSLGTSIVDPTVKLAGASGGVYSLVTAHIASIILNWKEMSFPIVQLLVFLIVAASDVGTSIYNRYVLDIDEHIGYAAHFAGALAGLLVGINVLRNLSETRTERIIWWISMVSYGLLMGICIVWNVAWKGYFPAEKY
ncbi:unnamed protein product [Phyllotreta striolata]|uniref:EF-hand domain-containing protein n=1 Tax=Phyllotreta striolata TaxID=444603 RepID=A0A9N9TW86_PHYSR|nr:unnamed protein product [Phyllotreta striolata]